MARHFTVTLVILPSTVSVLFITATVLLLVVHLKLSVSVLCVGCMSFILSVKVLPTSENVYDVLLSVMLVDCCG